MIRLGDIPGIGVHIVGDAADAAADPHLLRLENLDTDIRPPAAALAATLAAVGDAAAESYLPFQGWRRTRSPWHWRHRTPTPTWPRPTPNGNGVVS